MAQHRKRGRFSYDEPEPEEGHREKKVRFPKGKKESQSLQAIFEGEQADNSIKSTDPRVAATERAGRRSGALDRHEETSIPDDVYGAEEDYQDSEEEDEVEAAMEPFNLKQEREEGYFDADGNYVEYINQNVKDAWLDSAEVDTSLAAKHLKQYAEEEVELTLSSKDLAAIKRRIADALRPGETVLKALRRLKSTSTEKDRFLRAKMSNLTQETFDMLTDDAMKLLDHGEYNVYNEEKETFEREAEGYESLEKAKVHASTLSLQGESSTSGGMVGRELQYTSLFELEKLNGTGEEAQFSNDKASLPTGNSTEASMDMFADDDNEFARDNNSNQGEDHSGDSGYVYDEARGVLNKMTVKSRFPMPHIEYIPERLNGAKVFSKIDLKSGYHQVRIAKRDIYKTAFRTERGHYDFIVMPFRLTGAPVTFNRMMMMTFIDVVDNRLYIAAKKFVFFLTEVSYLGYIVSAEGIRLDQTKVLLQQFARVLL